jgi:hypothetical protein
MTPTQRTLKSMREQGRIVGIVERFNAHVGAFGIRQDLFGFIDLIAIDPQDGIVAIQSCGMDWSGHVRKLREQRNEAVFEWLKHAKVELWAWRKVKLAKGGVAMRWKPRIGDLILNDDGDFTIVERK